MMTTNEKKSTTSEVGPSVLLGLVGAVVVLLVLAAGIWGVGKIISKVRESRNDEKSTEQVASDTKEEGTTDTTKPTEDTNPSDEDSKDGDVNGDGATDSNGQQKPDDSEKPETPDTTNTEKPTSDASEKPTVVTNKPYWVANNYKKGDITGANHTVIWGDTLWEISEAKYGTGFEWTKIRDANLDIIGFLPDGSRALIIPGQVLALP